MHLKSIFVLSVGTLAVWPFPATAQWIKMPPPKTPRAESLEDICCENNKDPEHLPGKADAFKN